MHLIIMSCSAKKIASEDEIAAKDLYKGVFFAVRKNALQANPVLLQNTHTLIVSAKYGLIDEDDMVKTYDLRMSPQIAKAQREINTIKLKAIIEKLRPEDITIVMGKTYVDSLDFSQITIPHRFINGQIGIMLHEFKSWLISLESEFYYAN